MAEEQKDAARSAPRAILVAIISSAITGWALVIAMLFSIQDLGHVLATTSDYTGLAPGHGLNSPAQIMWDAFGARYNKSYLGNMMMFLPVTATWFCTSSLVTFVSRILFAYSRDKAVPLSNLWFRVDKRSGLPLTSVWGTVILAEILGIAILRDNYTINAILSLSVIALNIVYITPTICRCTVGRKRFRPGPFCLGKWVYPICALGTLWVGFAVCIFSLPQVYPGACARAVHPAFTRGDFRDAVYYRTLNFAGICWMATFIVCQLAFWMPKYGAKHWFEGPVNETNVRAWIKEGNMQEEAPRA